MTRFPNSKMATVGMMLGACLTFAACAVVEDEAKSREVTSTVEDEAKSREVTSTFAVTGMT